MTSIYRSLWISDTHLGSSAARTTDLLNFLEEVSADRLYLVGDIIDLERMKTRPNFCEPHMRVIRRFIDLANRGCEVVYVPGNHDTEVREMVGETILGVRIVRDAVHVTASGESLLVMHGDEFDEELRDGSSLERVGSIAYEAIMDVDVLVNRLRRKMRWDHMPISARIKGRIGLVNDFIDRFESAASRFACEQGFDGIICGHIHKPVVRRMHDVIYANDGDWVEHGSAVAETPDGRLELLNWVTDQVRVEHTAELAPIAA